jgi:hypothetical protein
VSTILEALRERDGTMPGVARSVESRDEPGATRRLWVVAAALGVASVAGLALLRWTSRSDDSQVPAAPAPLAVVEPPKAPAPLAAVEPPSRPASPVAPPTMDEPPHARVGRWKPAPPPPPPPPQAEAGAASETVSVAPGLLADEPREQIRLGLESIHYVAPPAERTVTLRIDGAPVTLHQGESAGGIEVQLIMREGVYVRQAGDVIALGELR